MDLETMYTARSFTRRQQTGGKHSETNRPELHAAELEKPIPVDRIPHRPLQAEAKPDGAGNKNQGRVKILRRFLTDHCKLRKILTMLGLETTTTIEHLLENCNPEIGHGGFLCPRGPSQGNNRQERETRGKRSKSEAGKESPTKY